MGAEGGSGEKSFGCRVGRHDAMQKPQGGVQGIVAADHLLERKQLLPAVGEANAPSTHRVVCEASRWII